jgi:hypothetical protein
MRSLALSFLRRLPDVPTPVASTTPWFAGIGAHDVSQSCTDRFLDVQRTLCAEPFEGFVCPH